MLCTTEQSHALCKWPPLLPSAGSEPHKMQPRTQLGRCHAGHSLNYAQQNILSPSMNQTTKSWFQLCPLCPPKSTETSCKLEVNSAPQTIHTAGLKKSSTFKTRLLIALRQFTSFLPTLPFKPIHLIRTHTRNAIWAINTVNLSQNTQPRCPHCFIWSRKAVPMQVLSQWEVISGSYNSETQEF